MTKPRLQPTYDAVQHALPFTYRRNSCLQHSPVGWFLLTQFAGIMTAGCYLWPPLFWFCYDHFLSNNVLCVMLLLSRGTRTLFCRAGTSSLHDRGLPYNNAWLAPTRMHGRACAAVRRATLVLNDNNLTGFHSRARPRCLPAMPCRLPPTLPAPSPARASYRTALKPCSRVSMCGIFCVQDRRVFRAPALA